jgi:cellulose synthase/poly-beta-1,6-N-acetylglucosamine synthase-like glycosyltransferase
LRGLLRARPYESGDITPAITIVLAAHNEAANIGAKLENVLSLDYPTEQLEVIVASDGCDDGTDEIVERFEDPRVRLLSLPRCGKAAALNEAVDVASGEILVFSDANSMYAPDALRYWNLDRVLKDAESRAGDVISATGAIYAVRRFLFHEIPPGVTDDFYTSTGVIAQGYRLVFAPDAVAFEPVARTAELEFGRKVRIMSRGLRGVILRRELLNPRRQGFYAIELLTHKVLRRTMALPLGVLAVTSPLLWRSGRLYRAATLAQAALYGLGGAGMILAGKPLGRRKAFMLPAFFCFVNIAALRATWNVVRGRRIDRWEPQRHDARLTDPEAGRSEGAGPGVGVD